MPHAPLFKDVGKIPSLYRTGLGLGYPYSSSLLHPAAPYVPPAPLSSYAPKPVVSAAGDPAKPPLPPAPPRPNNMKTGKWNAMHVRIAWEIYNHQQKEKSGAVVSSAPGVSVSSASSVPSLSHLDKDKLRAFPAPAPPPAPAYRSPYDLPPAPYLPHHPHLGQHFSVNFSGMSPFARYGAGPFPGAPTFLSPYGRDLMSSSLHGVHHPPPLGLHDAWRVRPQAPPSAAARERELERVRTRSPLRNGAPETIKEERKEPPRPPPSALGVGGVGGVGSVGGYGPPHAPWDPYRAAFDPLQHMRFAPLVEAAIRAEEDRAKMLSAYAHHQQLKAAPLLHRGLPPHAPLPPLGPHAPLAPLPPLAPHAPPLAPLAPLDLLKKEEPR
ncbi:fibrosin-1-like protein isoform X1 [Phthorimaea operculella]|nr:fibrosin-1-like protein isoform X1 [Phthorimaea operculella]